MMIDEEPAVGDGAVDREQDVAAPPNFSTRCPFCAAPQTKAEAT
jgi:hypothetical protein